MGFIFLSQNSKREIIDMNHTETRQVLDALNDVYSGLFYIRMTHGELSGVGWDRAIGKAKAAVALCEASLARVVEPDTSVLQAAQWPPAGDAQQIQSTEPEAMRYDFDGYGWKYIDNGSGSDWMTRHPEGEFLFTKPQAAAQPSQAGEQITEVVVHADYREMWQQQIQMNQKLCAELSKQTSQVVSDDEIEQLRADSERLDYLDSLATYSGSFMGGIHTLEFTHEFDKPNGSFRAAIDAAKGTT